MSEACPGAIERKDIEMDTNTDYIIFDEEIKDKLEYDRQSAFNDISGIFRFASEVLRTGGKVTVRRRILPLPMNRA